MTFFLVAINGILGELGIGVDGSLFAVDLAMYTDMTEKNRHQHK